MIENGGLSDRLHGFVIGQRISLTGKTRHGKNRIREHGENWIVTKVVNQRLFGDHNCGVMVKSQRTNEERWLTNDFEVSQ
jgi:hypothetical protein